MAEGSKISDMAPFAGPFDEKVMLPIVVNTNGPQTPVWSSRHATIPVFSQFIVDLIATARAGITEDMNTRLTALSDQLVTRKQVFNLASSIPAQPLNLLSATRTVTLTQADLRVGDQVFIGSGLPANWGQRSVGRVVTNGQVPIEFQVPPISGTPAAAPVQLLVFR